MRLRTAGFLAVLFALLLALPAQAQERFGGIAGVVTDASAGASARRDRHHHQQADGRQPHGRDRQRRIVSRTRSRSWALHASPSSFRGSRRANADNVLVLLGTNLHREHTAEGRRSAPKRSP